MTRWARANNVHKHKAAEATPWSQLKGGGAARGGAGGGGGGGAGGGGAGGSSSSGSGAGRRPQSSPSGRPAGSYRGPPAQRDGRAPGGADPLRRTHTTTTGGSGLFRKKKEYHDNTDVNGFLEYLQETGQALPRGGGGGRQEEDRGLREEVETALWKDRRREDRRIKRQDNKKSSMLCFNCRRPGHGVSDCPEARRDQEMGTGICYRCGSTEHDLQTCRAKVDPALGDYPYAKCFICGQNGHLSSSCPDNPKGLYAAGGCCRVCGSVEHFQKDCPEHQASSNSVTVGWLSNNMSADHEDVQDQPEKKEKPKQTKVVKF